MLGEPPQPTDTDVSATVQLCLAGGKVVAYVNSSALPSLLWDFWYLAAKSFRGEDISLWSSSEQSDVPGCVALGYCEITLAGEGPVGGVLHNPTAEFLHRERRVDLFVNRTQAEHGYQSLQKLGVTWKQGKRLSR